MATRGLAMARIRSASEKTVATRMPCRMPSPSTPSTVSTATANSVPLVAQSARSCSSRTRRATAAITSAARTGCGSPRKKPVATSRIIAIQIDATTSDIGVSAPAVSFTADCDAPPDTG